MNDVIYYGQNVYRGLQRFYNRIHIAIICRVDSLSRRSGKSRKKWTKCPGLVPLKRKLDLVSFDRWSTFSTYIVCVYCPYYVHCGPTHAFRGCIRLLEDRARGGHPSTSTRTAECVRNLQRSRFSGRFFFCRLFTRAKCF